MLTDASIGSAGSSKLSAAQLKNFGRELVRADAAWLSAETRPNTGRLGSAAAEGEWDQFAANRKIADYIERSRTTSTYDDNLYTTELHRANLTSAQIARADTLVENIEKSKRSQERQQQALGDCNYDPEDCFSGVLVKAGGADGDAQYTNRVNLKAQSWRRRTSPNTQALPRGNSPKKG